MPLPTVLHHLLHLLHHRAAPAPLLCPLNRADNGLHGRPQHEGHKPRAGSWTKSPQARKWDEPPKRPGQETTDQRTASQPLTRSSISLHSSRMHPSCAVIVSRGLGHHDRVQVDRAVFLAEKEQKGGTCHLHQGHDVHHGFITVLAHGLLPEPHSCCVRRACSALGLVQQGRA